MSSEGGKIKSKRRQAPNKPYDRNLTLFGKLRKSVKDLLVPSWLLGSHQQNEQEATGDACQASEASTVAQMDSNCFSSGTQLHNRAGDGISSLDQTPSLVDSTKEQRGKNVMDTSGHDELTVFTGEPYQGRHHARKVSDRLAAEKLSHDISVNSKLSGARPQDTRSSTRLRMSESYQRDADDENNETMAGRPILTSTRSLNQSVDLSQTATKRQRLWSPESNTQGVHLLSPVKEKPAFNSLLLGSMSDSAMFGDSFNKSVFYPGKTRFGGASAERRTSLNTSLPYQSSLPLRKQVRAAHNKSNTIQATTSSTAQRILETLDKMSTPLGDARKMSIAAESSNDSVLSFSPTSYRQTSFHTNRPMTRPLQLPTRGPPTSQHQALAQAVIAKNRYRSGVVDRRNLSVTVDDEVSEDKSTSQEPTRLTERTTGSSETRTGLGQQSGALGKMKVKRFSQHITNAGADSDNVTEVPNLRTDFTLPVSKMSPITLQSYSVKPHVVSDSSIPPSDESVPPLKFIFSAPIDVEDRRQANCQLSGTTDKNFKFTSPIKPSQTKTSAAGAEGGSKTCQEPAVGASSVWTSSAAFTASIPAWGSTAPKPKVSSPDIGGTSSSFKSYSKWGSFEKPDDSSAASDTPVGFSLAPAASLKSGSVMDILGGGGKSSAPATDDLMAKFKKPAGSWECQSCMLVNNPDKAKCVCCDTSRPGAKPAQTSAAEPTSKPGMGTADSFKTSAKEQSGTSKCDSFTTSSKSETAKPGTKQPLNGTGIGSDNSLSVMFKKPAGTWECDTCMVQNTAGAVRCIACDSSKPGLQSAGIVSKAPASSSGASAIMISPAGGFTFNTSAMTTTTSGSGGFKFGNTNFSSTSSTSIAPPATGFVFGQTTSSNKDSSSLASSTASTSLTGGFKFGATSPEGDSGGTMPGTSGITNSGSGFSYLPGKINDGVQTGATAGNVLKSDVPDVKSCLTLAGSRSDTVEKSGVPSTTTDLNKSNNFVGPSAAVFQFGSVASTNSTALHTSSVVVQSGTQFNSNDNSKLPNKEINFNFAPSGTTPQSFSTIPAQPHPSEKPDASASKPANSLFQFGASSAVPTANTGLGMGKNLSDSKPAINGGFGSSFEVQTVKGDSKPATLDGNKSFGNFVAFGAAPNLFGGFGQTPGPVSEPLSSQSSKRTVDFNDPDQPTAKKSFNFGAGGSEPSSNGLFAFSGSSESKASPFVVSSTAGHSTGGFMFNPPATQTGGPAPGGGFQFPLGSSAVAPAFQGFNFSVKTQSEVTEPSFEAAANKGPVSFNATPNFNFSAIPQQAVFQFGAKPAENLSSTPGVFTFGATHPSSGSSESSGFGASAGVGAVGNFSIGTGDRKIKKGVRRMRK